MLQCYMQNVPAIVWEKQFSKGLQERRDLGHLLQHPGHTAAAATLPLSQQPEHTEDW